MEIIGVLWNTFANTYVEVASPDFMTNSFCIFINRQRYDRIESLITWQNI